MKTLLLVDGCIRGADSRTLRLARRLAGGCAREGIRLETLSLLSLPLAPLDADGLFLRDMLCREKFFDHPLFDLARQFKHADAVIIAAPCWDCSFPSMLRVYLERLYVPGFTFYYTDSGQIIGLCEAQRMVYVTTRGGHVNSGSPGAVDLAGPYLHALCSMLGVPRIDCLSADGLDIPENDSEALLCAAEAQADQIAETFWS